MKRLVVVNLATASLSVCILVETFCRVWVTTAVLVPVFF